MKTLRQRSDSWSSAVSAAFAVLCMVIGFAPRGNAAVDAPQRRQVSSAQFVSEFAIADFDGDSKPDFASVQSGQADSWNTRYWIAFQLSTGSRQTLGITAPTGGLQLASRDVNGDNLLDVVVTTAWTNRPVAVLLNDGRGNFTRFDPSAFQGALWNSETSWNSKTDELKDVAAVLQARHPSGDCEETRNISSPRNVTRRLVFFASQPWSLFQAASFLGRAPPSLF